MIKASSGQFAASKGTATETSEVIKQEPGVRFGSLKEFHIEEIKSAVSSKGLPSAKEKNNEV